MTPIERAARKIARGAGTRVLGADHAQFYEDNYWQTYIETTKDVLGALREPSEAMVKAGTIGWDALDGSPVKPMFDPTKPFTAMIDAALQEKPDG